MRVCSTGTPGMPPDPVILCQRLDPRVRACEGNRLSACILLAAGYGAKFRAVSSRVGTPARGSTHYLVCCLSTDPRAGGSGGFGPQPMRRHQIVGERMPQCYRLGLEQTANRNEAEPMVLQVGVDPLDELAKSVRLLAGLCSHPGAPLLYALWFPLPLLRPLGERFRLDVVALARCRRKYLHRAGRMLGQCGDVFAGGVMGVYQKSLRGLAIATNHVITHWGCQTRIIAPIRHLDRYNDALLGGDRNLRVVSRADRPVRKAHASRLGIAERDFRLGLLLRLILRMRLRPLLFLGPNLIERRARAFGALLHLPCRPLLSGSLAARGSLRIALDLRLERGKPLLYRSLDPRQFRAALERVPARIRPHLSAVDDDLGQRHHPLANQCRNAFAQKTIEHLDMADPEVRKPVIIQRHPAGDPPIRQIALRKPLKLPRRANPLNGRVKPQCQQNCRIRRRPSRLAFTRLDAIVKRLQIHALDKAHHDAGAMINRQQPLQIKEVPPRLNPIRPNKPRLVCHRITSRCSESESQLGRSANFFTRSDAGLQTLPNCTD